MRERIDILLSSLYILAILYGKSIKDPLDYLHVISSSTVLGPETEELN